MVLRCCASNCASTRQDAILYKFPSNADRHRHWLFRLGLERSATRRFVCQKHFEKRFIGPGSRLLQKAYPSLFTPNEISTGIPDNNTENINPHEHEHCYARKRVHIDHNYCKVGSTSSELSHFRPVLSAIQEEQETNENVVPRPSLAMVQSSLSEKTAGIAGNEGHSSTFSQKCTQSPTPTAVPHPTLTVVQSSPVEKTSSRAGNEGHSSTFAQKKTMSPAESALERGVATTPTGKTIARKRLIDKFRKLTPTAKKIYEEYKKATRQKSYLSRAKRALKFSKDRSFEQLSNDMNPYAKQFLAMQIKLCKKTKQGRRFSLDQKLIALAIMKQGPKCYRFLARIFILPSVTTLNKLVTKINIEPGINPKLFDLMTKEVSNWKTTKKYCSIIFDEMALGMGVSYDQKKDKVNGFVELNERKNKFADHVLVFMLRGAIHKWQQPITYHFCEGATSGTELKKIIKDIVEAVSQTGLKPIVLGCDQGPSFQSAIKSLQADTRREMLLRNEEPDDTIIIANNKLHIIYDPSHLIKGIRNNFLNKDIKMDGKISKWQDIVDVYQTDSDHTESRILHKLNDEHVIPAKIKKMKVKNCVRVLSKTVAAALTYTAKFSHYIDGKAVSSTTKNTAETVSFFDDLFDSVNGASLSHKNTKGKALRSAVHDDSNHHKFWPEAIKVLEEMRFIDSNKKEKIVPSMKNFVTTLQSYMKLWQNFKTLGLKIMRPRYFNTDPIENFFGQVRAYNYRNNDPTCHNFINTFKALTITRVLNFHSPSYNCEDDPAQPLINLKPLFEECRELENSDKMNDVVRSDQLNQTPINIPNIVEQARRERLATHSRAYVTGWVVNKYLKKISCQKCKEGLTSTPNDTTHQWISEREYKTCKNSTKLCYPSEKAVRLVGTIQQETNEYLENNAHKKEIKKHILENIVSKYSCDLVNCPEHEAFCRQYLMDVSFRFAIYNWCNVINKILKGVDVVRLQGKSLPYFQNLALKKYEKRYNKSSKT